MVARCLDSLVAPGVQLIIVDNGSTADVKRAIKGRDAIVIRNKVNHYVNPAWNQVMAVFLSQPGYDLLVLANSDLVLDPGWAQKLGEHRQTCQSDLIFGIDAGRQRPSLGSFFALSRRAVEAVYPIPDDLLVFGGDDFIFAVARGIGCKEHVLESLTMSHVERGTYDKSPEIWDVGRRDTVRWRRHVLPKLVPKRIAKILANKHKR